MVLIPGDNMSASHTFPEQQMETLGMPESLNIIGRGLSPNRLSSDRDHTARLSPATSSRPSSTGEDPDVVDQTDEYTVLDGVREMNHILVRQIETLRLKIKVDEKNHENDRARMLESKDEEVSKRETEIDDLKDSVCNRDERIHELVRAGNEKDRQIQSKCQEIEKLKDMVRQTESFASKLQKQVEKVKSEKEQLESDGLYKEQNMEISKLTYELETLRERLFTMECELQRALNVIEKQNERIKTMNDESGSMREQFREDLEKASKAMRQEVERMREIMRKNYSEMRHLREQNRQMHNDVRDIKELLLSSRSSQSSSSDHVEFPSMGLPMQRPLNSTSSPSQGHRPTTTYGKSSPLSPNGPAAWQGGNIARPTNHRYQQRNSSAKDQHNMQLGRSSTSIGEHRPLSRVNRLHSIGQDTNVVRVALSNRTSANTDASKSSHGSPDNGTSCRQTARSVANGPVRSSKEKLTISVSQSPLHAGQYSKADFGTHKNQPSVCSFKEGVAAPVKPPASKGGKAILRKGSAPRN